MAETVWVVIADDKTLAKLAKAARKNEQVKTDLNRLREKLAAGNLEAGLGMSSLQGTDIFYLRVKNGARLYVRNERGAYIIVAESGKQKNQTKVINRLLALYKR